ncbi:MAG: TetR/AcrR family transcriptional regulator [Gammaproteobacteria bacterium]|nr:TetR/AcrR family transcriptional regulator [Gammaproteobacteria bacterium]MCY4338879.1 TetR/AcrR family transcriptional regulator [Gammaproteobacteria bacterium]
MGINQKLRVTDRQGAAPAVKKMRKDAILKRAQLIKHATGMFLEMGYEKASMNNLVKRSGSSKSTVYKHFRSRQALFIAVLDEKLRDHLAPIENLDLTTLSIEEGLKLIGRTGIKVITSRDHINLCRIIYAEAERIPQVGRTYFEHGPKRGMAGVAKYLSTMVEKGKIRCADPALASQYFWGMILHKPMLETYCGIKGPMTTKQQKDYIDKTVDSFIAAFIEGRL